MICKGCGEDKRLIKAHVIPESFFRGLKDGDKAPRIHSTEDGVHPKKSPIGIYDKNILCFDCEQVFKQVDDYGFKVLIRDEDALEALEHDGKTVGYRANNIDYKMLKSFFLSILWRASVSQHYFYSGVNLGALETKLKNLVWENDSGDIHDYSFVLAKFEGDGAGRTIMDPHQERWFNVRYYRFYLYGYILYVKADSQKTPSKWEKFISQSNDDLIVVLRGAMEESKEYSILAGAVQESKT